MEHKKIILTRIENSFVCDILDNKNLDNFKSLDDALTESTRFIDECKQKNIRFYPNNLDSLEIKKISNYLENMYGMDFGIQY